MPGHLVLLRHGESEWNREQRFTGWADVALTPLGTTQMREAGCALRKAGIDVDIAFSSVLRRCVHSLWAVLDEMHRFWLPQTLDWRLNERHYGGLTGLLHQEAIREFGEAQVLRWRRSASATPPPVDERAAGAIALDERYAGCDVQQALRGESLLQTTERVRAAWHEALVPLLQGDRSILLVGHGNALRALIGVLENLSDDMLTRLEIANGAPILYEFGATLRPATKRVLEVGARTQSEIL